MDDEEIAREAEMADEGQFIFELGTDFAQDSGTGMRVTAGNAFRAEIGQHGMGGIGIIAMFGHEGREAVTEILEREVEAFM